MKLLMEMKARKSTPTNEGNGKPETIGTLQNNRITKPPEGKKINYLENIIEWVLTEGNAELNQKVIDAYPNSFKRLKEHDDEDNRPHRSGTIILS